VAVDRKRVLDFNSILNQRTMSQVSMLDNYPKLKGIVTWLTASARQSAFEKVTSSEGCGWITESLSRCNWMDIATWFILISYAVRLPFFVRYLVNCRKEPAANVACAHAEGKFSCYCYPLATVIGKLTMLYFANTNALPAWSQISPQFDLVAKIGTALGGLSLLLLLYIHFNSFISLEEIQTLFLETNHQLTRLVIGQHNTLTTEMVNRILKRHPQLVTFDFQDCPLVLTDRLIRVSQPPTDNDEEEEEQE
jgi:hypothetical protein